MFISETLKHMYLFLTLFQHIYKYLDAFIAVANDFLISFHPIEIGKYSYFRYDTAGTQHTLIGERYKRS